MDLGITMLLAAFAGGLFGAAIGGLPAFVFTGFAVLIGVAAAASGSDFDFIGNVAFGPIFGPHVAFAGGAAAAAYAARRGGLEDGKDIAAPVTGVNDPMALIVGGLFGMGGHVVNQVLAVLTPFGESGFFYANYTDTVALTVVISGIVARLMFGRTGLFGSMDPESRQRGRFSPAGGGLVRLPAGIFPGRRPRSRRRPLVVLDRHGLQRCQSRHRRRRRGAGLRYLGYFADPATDRLLLPGHAPYDATRRRGGGRGRIGFRRFGSLRDDRGRRCRYRGALMGEFFSRLFLIHGDTHVDPPAAGIATMATVIIVVSLPFI